MKNNKNTQKQTVYVVMVDDVELDGWVERIQDCTVWAAKEAAIKQVGRVANGYKEGFINEYIRNGAVSFDEKNLQENPYIMIESDESFRFYERDSYNDNHIEVWILEKEIGGLS